MAHEAAPAPAIRIERTMPKHARRMARILNGTMEPVFAALPESVLDNLRRPASENALLWNLIYPLARPSLSLAQLLGLQPLWGSPVLEPQEDALSPFFWGHALTGERLPDLDRALAEVDGKGHATQVDLFLAGARNLVLVEAKHLGSFGRCGRFARGRCPEISPGPGGGTAPCRYWEVEPSRFSAVLDFGDRPMPEGAAPPCATHYQLARTLLLGRWLAQHQASTLHVWAIIPRTRWPALQMTWLEFVGRIRDEALWRRCRVLAWEDVRSLAEAQHPD
ncbi:MAG: hypothetical protein A2Z30_05585 [Chloroflexi bacterium RBG_16_64_43]|nr:MAG: hypothetical protein A2Z30_05585 [Chloroflexi bacterium RBG_16_64_43]